MSAGEHGPVPCLRGRQTPPEPSELDRARMRRVSFGATGAPRDGGAGSVVRLDRTGEIRAVPSEYSGGAGGSSGGSSGGSDGTEGGGGGTNEEVLTRDEVAALLKISTKTVTKLVNCEALPCTKVGREYRFLLSDVLHWMRTHDWGKTKKETE